jgi:hypothetical protein
VDGSALTGHCRGRLPERCGVGLAARQRRSATPITPSFCRLGAGAAGVGHDPDRAVMLGGSAVSASGVYLAVRCVPTILLYCIAP